MRSNARKILTGLWLGISTGAACHDSTAAVDDIGRACAQYCTRATECDQGLPFESCQETCSGALRGCDIEDMGAAIDDVDLCTGRSCEGVRGCALDPVLDCPKLQVFQ